MPRNVTPQVDGGLNAEVHQHLLAHTMAKIQSIEQIYGFMLEHAGANTALNVAAASPFEYDKSDAFLTQTLP